MVNDLRLGIVFALGALILWTNAHWIPPRWPGQESNRFFSVLCSRTSYVAALLAVTGGYIAWPWAWTAVAWASLALALAYAGRRLRIEPLSVQANVIAALCHLPPSKLA